MSRAWSVYSQQLCRAGLLSDTTGFRLTLAKLIARVLANTILDVRLHTLD